MAPRGTVIAVLALACAAAPAFAADQDERAADRPKEPTHAELSLPGGFGTLPVGRAIDGLNHLRLRPARNDCDVSETAHRPAHRVAE
jgi:hypothetical protein